MSKARADQPLYLALAFTGVLVALLTHGCVGPAVDTSEGASSGEAGPSDASSDGASNGDGAASTPLGCPAYRAAFGNKVLFCDDFDNGVFDGAWQRKDGVKAAASVVPKFADGSPPYALHLALNGSTSSPDAIYVGRSIAASSAFAVSMRVRPDLGGSPALFVGLTWGAGSGLTLGLDSLDLHEIVNPEAGAGASVVGPKLPPGVTSLVELQVDAGAGVYRAFLNGTQVVSQKFIAGNTPSGNITLYTGVQYVTVPWTGAIDDVVTRLL